jgi:hypothetical protein
MTIAAEAEKQAVKQVVIISDAFERRKRRRSKGEVQAAAQVWAAQLRDLGVKLVVGYEGSSVAPVRSIAPGQVPNGHFRTLPVTRENGGYVFCVIRQMTLISHTNDLLRSPHKRG